MWWVEWWVEFLILNIININQYLKNTEWRCCQSIANPSPIFADEQVLGDEKVAPLAKRGVSFLFEPDSGVDVPFEVEVLVH